MGSFFLLETYRNIKNNLPDYVLNSVRKLLPVYLISSIFEIFGLVIIFPAIKVILDPSYISSNYPILFLFEKLNFQNTTSFALFLFSSITLVFILKNVIL